MERVTDAITLEIPIASIGLRLLGVALTFLVGQWLARNSRKWLTAVMQKRGLPKSIVTLLASLTFATVWLLTLLVILALLGVPVYTLIAGIGLVVIVIGIALRESLGNFAATIIFALFKPFETGDLIETANTMGVVQEIELFNTVMLAGDNKVHILPNGLIQSSGLTNLSKMGKLRLDLRFGIGYGDDVAVAKQTLFDLLAADERVLADPAPVIFVKALGDSAVELAVWPYVRTEDYFAFQFDVLEQGKLLLEKAGITIPFPQRDVHLYHPKPHQVGDL
jgi:small conductance mechanosensitive channel